MSTFRPLLVTPWLSYEAGNWFAPVGSPPNGGSLAGDISDVPGYVKFDWLLCERGVNEWFAIKTAAVKKAQLRIVLTVEPQDGGLKLVSLSNEAYLHFFAPYDEYIEEQVVELSTTAQRVVKFVLAANGGRPVYARLEIKY